MNPTIEKLLKKQSRQVKVISKKKVEKILSSIDNETYNKLSSKKRFTVQGQTKILVGKINPLEFVTTIKKRIFHLLYKQKDFRIQPRIAVIPTQPTYLFSKRKLSNCPKSVFKIIASINLNKFQSKDLRKFQSKDLRKFQSKDFRKFSSKEKRRRILVYLKLWSTLFKHCLQFQCDKLQINMTTIMNDEQQKLIKVIGTSSIELGYLKRIEIKWTQLTSIEFIAMINAPFLSDLKLQKCYGLTSVNCLKKIVFKELRYVFVIYCCRLVQISQTPIFSLKPFQRVKLNYEQYPKILLTNKCINKHSYHFIRRNHPNTDQEQQTPSFQQLIDLNAIFKVEMDRHDTNHCRQRLSRIKKCLTDNRGYSNGPSSTRQSLIAQKPFEYDVKSCAHILYLMQLQKLQYGMLFQIQLPNIPWRIQFRNDSVD